MKSRARVWSRPPKRPQDLSALWLTKLTNVLQVLLYDCCVASSSGGGDNIAVLLIHHARDTCASFNNGSLSILAYIRPTPFTRSPCGNATSPWLQHWNPAGGWQNGEAQYSARQKRSRIEERRRATYPYLKSRFLYTKCST